MKDLEFAKNSLLQSENTFILVKSGEILKKSDNRGLKPILEIYNKEKNLLKNATIADRVIGKAAAMLLIDAEIKSLYAEVISNHALEILKKTQIEFDYSILVDEIKNRDRSDTCPMEKLALDSYNTDELILKIEEFFRK